MPVLTIDRSAVISDDQLYRYTLLREWKSTAPKAVFCMLNPSTADGEHDDATIRRCLRFASDWNCGSLVVVNLFAARCTDPKKLPWFNNPVGPECDQHIREAVAAATGPIVAAWGAQPNHRERIHHTLELLRTSTRGQVQCLGLTRHGYPRHPLYVTAAAQLIPYP